MRNMWLIVSWWVAILATISYIYSKNPKTYRLDMLCLMLWGLAIMVLVDHVLGLIIEGGEFIEVSINGTLIGITMLIPIFVIWEVTALLKKNEKSISKNSEAG
ncbi:MAG: hypothetical protein RMI79_05570 [Nitrososphaerota archaeon]|nr:hypothetical protein [Nitrososphaerota archaeon]